MSLAKNLAGCLVAGVILFGLAVFREVVVENKTISAAASTGLVVGGGIAAILGVLVFVFWRREQTESSADDQ